MFNEETIAQAFGLFNKLIEKGWVSRKDDPTHELLNSYDEEDVRTVLNVLSRQAGVIIDKTVDGTIYIFPTSPSSLYGASNEELRKMFKVKDNLGLYVCYFIVMCFLAMFYSTDNYTDKSRDFATFEDIRNYIDKIVESTTVNSDIEQFSTENQVCFFDVVQFWEKLSDIDERSVRRIDGVKANKVTFIENTLNILKDLGYVVTTEEGGKRIYWVQNKLTLLMKGYYGSDTRKIEILNYLTGRKSEEE